MTKRRIYRSEQEWLQIITEGRQSGLTDHAWCELHNISNSSFYNAPTFGCVLYLGLNTPVDS